MLFKNRKNNQNKIKIPGKKRQILTTIALSLILLFGKARVSSSQSPSSSLDNQKTHEKLINNRQIILAKAESNPITPPTNRGPSNFPTPPSSSRPSRFVNPFRRAPKLAPGPGAAANPAGAGNGGNADEWKDQCPAPKKEIETSNYRSSSSSKKKKKKSVKIGSSVVTINSDSNGNPIFTIEKNNGSKIICTYEQALYKYYHADVHGLQFPEGFNKTYAMELSPTDRKVYTASTVPKEEIIEFLKANVASLSSDKLKAVPGFIGPRKESGTIYFNRNSRELHFVNEMTNEWRTTVVQSERQFRELAKNDFHLFPNAGH